MRINHLMAAMRPVDRCAGAMDWHARVIQAPISTYPQGTSVPTVGFGHSVDVPAVDPRLAERTTKQHDKGPPRGSLLI